MPQSVDDISPKQVINIVPYALVFVEAIRLEFSRIDYITGGLGQLAPYAGLMSCTHCIISDCSLRYGVFIPSVEMTSSVP